MLSIRLNPWVCVAVLSGLETASQVNLMSSEVSGSPSDQSKPGFSFQVIVLPSFVMPPFSSDGISAASAGTTTPSGLTPISPRFTRAIAAAGDGFGGDVGVHRIRFVVGPGDRAALGWLGLRHRSADAWSARESAERGNGDTRRARAGNEPAAVDRASQQGMDFTLLDGHAFRSFPASSCSVPRVGHGMPCSYRVTPDVRLPTFDFRPGVPCVLIPGARRTV